MMSLPREAGRGRAVAPQTGGGDGAMRYAFGDYSLDTQRYELRRAGELIPLGPQVFNVLAYLVAQRDRVVSRDELFARLWPGQFVSEDALERCIREARRALADTRQASQLIQTIRGRGYRFLVPVEVRRLDASDGEGPTAPGTAQSPVPQALDGAKMDNPSVPGHEGGNTRRLTLSAPEGEHKPV